MATVIQIKRSEVAQSVPSAGSLTAGELAMNVTDGKFYTKTAAGAVKEIGGAGSATLQDITTNGNVTITDIVLDQGAKLVFEGNLANSSETFLTATEPTADRTITLPDQSGALAMDGDALAYSIVFGG